MKVLFLETRQNEVWVSMQEILPHIKKVWTYLSNQKGWEFHCVDVDNSSPTSYRKDILEADLIVIPAFNARVAQSLVVIRKMLGVETPWVFYLHNQATIGLWPLFALGIGDLLHSGDIFLGTCDGDHEAIKRSLTNFQFFKTYFATEDNLENLPSQRSEDINDILFIGRISCQKNLHSLLIAFKKLKKEKPTLTLHLYGKEDELGSPNMEWKGEGYLAFLNRVIKEETIEDVNFYGFVNRETIKETWRGKRFLFCSPSLHSDENFGMAALSALEIGGNVVLSDWGGHKNYLEYFPNRVEFVSVFHQNFGPFIEVDSLFLALKNSLESKGENSEVSSPFCLYKISQTLAEYLESSLSNQNFQKCMATQLARDLVEKRTYFHQQDPNLLQKVFENYQDPNAQVFFEAYGAQLRGALGKGELLPWAKVDTGKIRIEDPIKKDLILTEDEAKKMGYYFEKN